jgi:aspartate kinase
LPNAIEELSLEFAVRYNSNLKLITIRHFTDRAIEEHSRGKEFFLMQKTRGTVRIVYKEK